MGRLFAVLLASVIPGMCMAHPGHLVEAAGHTHWVAGAAIGAAIVLGLWAGLRGRKNDDAANDDGAIEDQSDSEGEAEAA